TARSQADEDLVVPEIIEGNRLDSDALAGRVQHRPPIAHRERLRRRFYRTVVWYIVRARGTAGGEGERAYPRAAAAASVRRARETCAATGGAAARARRAADNA